MVDWIWCSICYNSNCGDIKMVIILSADDTPSSISTGLYCCANAVLQMTEDGKGFIVHKHRRMKIEAGAQYHMSNIINIIKAAL